MTFLIDIGWGRKKILGISNAILGIFTAIRTFYSIYIYCIEAISLLYKSEACDSLIIARFATANIQHFLAECK